jgi:hypothetical protein
MSAAGRSYDWIEGWAEVPSSQAYEVAWAHNGLAVTRDGFIVGLTHDSAKVLVFDEHGRLQRAFDCGIVEGHGLAIHEEGGKEYLWVADCGLRLRPKADSTSGYEPWIPKPAGCVLKVDLVTGAVVTELAVPRHELYDSGAKYLPTSIAPTTSGDVWVADGYGASLLHRFGPSGDQVATFTGEESNAGRFNCPHGILIDHRRAEPELYVADRGNERLLVFDLHGAFKREVGQGLFAAPSALALGGDLLVVGELQGRVTLLDTDDNVVGHLGDNVAASGRPGWPNELIDGETVRPRAQRGKFGSPHGLAVDQKGNIYVSEFVIAGRHIKLNNASPAAAGTGDG